MLNPPAKYEFGITTPSGAKFAVIRRDPASLFMDLPKWFENLNVQEILSHDQSESNGNITISIVYK